MARKAKSATVKKIEKAFQESDKPEMAFSEIAQSVGVGANKALLEP